MAASLALQWSHEIFSRVYNLDFVGFFFQNVGAEFFFPALPGYSISWDAIKPSHPVKFSSTDKLAVLSRVIHRALQSTANLNF